MDTYFSIVIPTYNREALLPRALDGIIAQTYPNWECIVVDDHSNDNTMSLLKSYCESDSRIKVVTNNHRKGAPGARNTGLDYAKYDWVLFFDSDNYMHSNLLETVSKSMDDDHDVFVWFSNVLDAESGKKVSTFEPICTENMIEDILTERCYVDTNNAVIRKSKLIEICGWDELCPSMEEWDIHIRLSRSAKYLTIHQHLVDYFIGRLDSISTDLKKGVECRIYLLKKHRLDWLHHREAGMMNFTETLKIAKRIGFRSYLFKIRIILFLNAPRLSWIYLKRRIKSLLHA